MLWFLSFLVGLVLVGWLVKKLTGAKTYLVETFPLEPDERVLWEDREADAYPIPNRQTAYVTYLRWKRAMVRVTNRRLVCGTKGLFGRGHIVQYVLYPSDRAFPEQARSLGGGLFTVGYQVLVFERASVARETEKTPSFVELTLACDLQSSLNLRAFRVYSQSAISLPLPE